MRRRAGGGHGGVVWCGVVQPTNNQVSNVTALSDQRMAGQHVNIVVGTVGSEGRYMYSYLLPPTRKLFVVMRQTHRRILYER